MSAPSGPEQSLTMTPRAGDPSNCFVQKGLGNQNANSLPPHQGHLPPTDHTSEVLTLPLAPFLPPCAEAWGVGTPTHTVGEQSSTLFPMQANVLSWNVWPSCDHQGGTPNRNLSF